MNQTISRTGAARDQLVSDMKAVIVDAEELLKATAGAANERVSAARARAEESLRTAKTKLSELDDVMIERAKEAATAADDYVREHPWGAIGAAAVIGLVAGVIIAKR